MCPALIHAGTVAFPRRPFRAAVLILLLAAIAQGCGASRRIATGTMVGVLEESVAATFRDPDLETAAQAVPANLVLVRGFCETNPGHRELHAIAAQLYFSHAFGFVEDQDPERASLLYAEGLRLGRQGLGARGWYRRAESIPGVPGRDLLDAIPREDVPLLFWTLANWSSWISLHLEDPAALADLAVVQVYLSRVLELDPDYFLGMPHVLLGALECYRPVLFGGNPEEGKKQFEEAFRVSGNRMLLYHVFFARYYCRQVLDEEGFKKALEFVLATPGGALPEYRLFNEVAKRKAALFLEKMNDYF